MGHRRHVSLGVACLVAGALAGAVGCAPKRVPENADMEIMLPDNAARVRKQLPSSGGHPSEEKGATVSPALPAPRPRARSGVESPPPSPATQAPSLGERAAALARQQLGKPYQWGAAGPDRFDCSGLVHYVYRNLGVSLPRVSSEQAGAGTHVDRDDLKPGDLVFFTLRGSRINHVGIYLGHGKFIHAPRRYMPVRIDSLNNSWWRRRFKGGRRLD